MSEAATRPLDPDRQHLAPSEPKAGRRAGAHKVLAASSLGSCLVFVKARLRSRSELAALGREMRLSPARPQLVMNARSPAARGGPDSWSPVLLVPGSDRKRIFLSGDIVSSMPGATAPGFRAGFRRHSHRRPVLAQPWRSLDPAQRPFRPSVLGQAFLPHKPVRSASVRRRGCSASLRRAAIAVAILDTGPGGTTFLMLPPLVPARWPAAPYGYHGLPGEATLLGRRRGPRLFVRQSGSLAGFGGCQPTQRFRSEPLVLVTTVVRCGRTLSFLHRDRRIGRQRHAVTPRASSSPRGGLRREPVHRAPLRSVHDHADLDPVRG